MFEYSDIITIISIQAIVSPDPDKSPGIFKDGIDIVRREPMFGGKMAEGVFMGLRHGVARP